MVNRILIVGHGSIGKRHLRIARRLLPDADICVLSNQTLQVIPQYASRCATSLDEALAFAPEVAVIASPSPFHTQMAQLMADAGVHLMVEKPLSAVIDGCDQLIRTCDRNSLVLMTAYNLRFLPSLQEFRRMVGSGLIGEVISVRCEVGQYLPSWRPGMDYRHGVSGSRALGGGVLLELSHEIDYLRWIFGEVSWVQAVVGKQSSLEVDVEDTAHLVLGLRRGDESRQLIANLNMDFIRHDTTRQCLAIGSEGSLRWNGLTGCVDVYSAGASSWDQIFSHLPESDETYTLEWQHFLDCVQNGSNPLIDGRDGLASLRVIEAARLSASKNKAKQVIMEVM